MKVTQVAVRPTETSLRAGRPALTPELLAASGARYSRNNEGLDAILTRIDPDDLDKSVESIFRMIDYGHQSIADMAPVAMFLDGISIWLAYYIWSISPTAGGQESSTRYIRLSVDGLIPPDRLGIEQSLVQPWAEQMERAFSAYQRALSLWEGLAAQDPSLLRIPSSLLNDSSDMASKKIARMTRNYAFDRARYFLPVAAETNVMLIMSARGWTQLCQELLSHPLPEPQAVGNAIKHELGFATPRLLKHAEEKKSISNGLAQEFSRWRKMAIDMPNELSSNAQCIEAAPIPFLEVMPTRGIEESALAEDLANHDNRYAWIGSNLRRMAVRFGWKAVALAEIRDLNRHRTGTKYCPLVPQGFYFAADQLPHRPDLDQKSNALHAISVDGQSASRQASKLLSSGDPSFVYWTLLGTQYPFEHLTTADKFIYEAELRTGVGAHYRYAKHLHDALELWYARYPGTKTLILEGSAEPE